MTKNQKSLIGILILLVGFIYLVSPVLAPFLVAAIFAYLGNPLVEYLMRLHLPRSLAAIVVMLLTLVFMLLICLLIIPLVEQQLVVFSKYVPVLLQWIQEKALPWLSLHFGLKTTLDIDFFKRLLTGHWEQAGDVAGVLWKTVSQSGIAILRFAVNTLLVFVVLFYLLRDWKKILNSIRSLLPRVYEPTIVRLIQQCNEVLGAFFRGQLSVMFLLALIYALGLSLIGLNLSLLIALIAGLLSIVPYLGTFTGFLLAVFASLIQFGDITHVVYVVLVFVSGNAFEGLVLTPLLMGNRIGLHPVAVIFAVIAGGNLFGFTGVLLALPCAAIIMVLLRFARDHYFKSRVYHEDLSQ